MVLIVLPVLLRLVLLSATRMRVSAVTRPHTRQRIPLKNIISPGAYANVRNDFILHFSLGVAGECSRSTGFSMQKKPPQLDKRGKMCHNI